MSESLIKMLNSIHNTIMAILKGAFILFVASKLLPEYITVTNFTSAITVIVLYSLIGYGLSVGIVRLLTLIPGFDSDTVFGILLLRFISIACHLFTIAVLSYHYAPFTIINNLWAYFIFYFITSAKLDSK